MNVNSVLFGIGLSAAYPVLPANQFLTILYLFLDKRSWPLILTKPVEATGQLSTIKNEHKNTIVWLSLLTISLWNNSGGCVWNFRLNWVDPNERLWSFNFIFCFNHPAPKEIRQAMSIMNIKDHKTTVH